MFWRMLTFFFFAWLVCSLGSSHVFSSTRGLVGWWVNVLSLDVQVGKEFESVEALWSQFEGVMGKNPDEPKTEDVGEGEDTRMGG